MDILKLIGRKNQIFDSDLFSHNEVLDSMISNSSFLVIGGAGSIGQSVTIEIFKRNPKVLHVVDISENNLVELVRNIRSVLGYIKGDFSTFALDSGSSEFEVFFESEGPYDYILNLSALKHVRSEKDPFTLMRLIEVNIFNTVKISQLARKSGAKKYFCVSTDKAANPVNMMGCSKRIMELFLMRESLCQNISMSRFANVAFSDGSLLHGFKQRFENNQPISAPFDVRRYFVTPQESGELCLMSCLLGENRDIFFPRLNQDLHLTTFSTIAENFLNMHGYEPYECESEEEARNTVSDLIRAKKWPCYFFKSDTTGEKDFEEFFTSEEELDIDRFTAIGVIKNLPIFDESKLSMFERTIVNLRENLNWSRNDLVKIFFEMIPDFGHKETGKFLDQRM